LSLLIGGFFREDGPSLQTFKGQTFARNESDQEPRSRRSVRVGRIAQLQVLAELDSCNGRSIVAIEPQDRSAEVERNIQPERADCIWRVRRVADDPELSLAATKPPVPDASRVPALETTSAPVSMTSQWCQCGDDGPLIHERNLSDSELGDVLKFSSAEQRWDGESPYSWPNLPPIAELLTRERSNNMWSFRFSSRKPEGGSSDRGLSWSVPP
jgi:hypothetical protein